MPTSTSMSSELGWARYITKERFMMPKPQLQQAAALVILPDIKTNAQEQSCIKEMTSKLATGGANHIRSSLLVVFEDTATVSCAGVGSS